MTRACRDAVRSATGSAFSDAEIDDFLDRLVRGAKARRKEAPTEGDQAAIRAAMAGLTRAAVSDALTGERLRLAAETARIYRRPRLDAMAATLKSEAKALSAFDVGAEKLGRYTGASVDAEGRARAMGLWGQVERGLNAVPGLKDRLSNFAGLRNREFELQVRKEMMRLTGDGGVEPTGDDGAVHAARVFTQALGDAREQQNALGAWIGELQGYAGRQSYDRGRVAGGFWREMAQGLAALKRGDLRGAVDFDGLRVASAKAAFRTFRDDFLQHLDHERTFGGLELQDVDFSKWEDEAEESRQLGRKRDLADNLILHANGVIDDPTSLKERMLYRVWADMVTGRHEALSGADDHADFRPPASKARSVSAARVLHWKSPESAQAIADRWGNRGGLYATVMGQLERGGKNAALMKAWGPAPEAARMNEIARLDEAAKARGDVGAAGALYGGKLAGQFGQLTGAGNIPENLRLAQVMRTIRVYEGLVKLGGITLSKATDIPIAGQQFARVGAGFLAGYDGAIRGVARLQGEEGRRAAELLDVGARSFAGHLMSGYAGADGPQGWGAWASRLHYKLNLFEYANEGVRKGGAEVLSHFLGQESDKGWDALQQGTRETFERFGITPADWDAVRGGIEPASDGRKYFTLDHLDGKDGASAALGLKFRVLVHDFLDNLVSEPRARERAWMTANAKPGTIMGEVLRGFWQFKGFVNTIVGRHLAPQFEGYAGMHPAALLAHFIVGTTLAGYLSMQAKQIAAGRQPRPLLKPDGTPDGRTWLAALAQGGGLGIYGDYLFGEANRNGLNFSLSSLGGPFLGDLEQVAQMGKHAMAAGSIDPEVRAEAHALPGEATRFATTHVPLVNLFYTRLALDYLVFWRLQEAVNPGYLQRYEQRVRSKQGTEFYVPPTAAAH